MDETNVTDYILIDMPCVISYKSAGATSKFSPAIFYIISLHVSFGTKSILSLTSFLIFVRVAVACIIMAFDSTKISFYFPCNANFVTFFSSQTQNSIMLGTLDCMASILSSDSSS